MAYDLKATYCALYPSLYGRSSSALPMLAPPHSHVFVCMCAPPVPQEIDREQCTLLRGRYTSHPTAAVSRAGRAIPHIKATSDPRSAKQITSAVKQTASAAANDLRISRQTSPAVTLANAVRILSVQQGAVEGSSPRPSAAAATRATTARGGQQEGSGRHRGRLVSPDQLGVASPQAEVFFQIPDELRRLLIEVSCAGWNAWVGGSVAG